MKPIIKRLNNGLRVIIDPMPSLSTVALGVWANVGAIDEQTNEHGLAHLLEHMAFKGTKKRTARSLAEEIEAVGGYLNAATSHQRTGYYARVLSEDVPLAVDILADILQNPIFDEAELAREQDVIIQEIGEAADTPDDVVFELLMDAGYEGQPMGRTILGTPQSVKAQTRSSLRAFMERHYGPESMVIAIAGAVDEDAFCDLVEQKFAAMPSKIATSKRARPKWRGGLRHDVRKIEQTHLALGFPGASAREDDYFASRIYADVLGGGMSSRLFQKIREERGLAYSVYAFADGYDECGLTGVYLGADSEQIPEAARVIRDEMEAMTRSVSDDEIARTRAMLKSSLLMALESPAARIETSAGQMFAYGELLSPDTITARLEAVTIDDIKRCATRALEGGAPAIALVGAGDASATAAVFQ